MRRTTSPPSVTRNSAQSRIFSFDSPFNRGANTSGISTTFAPWRTSSNKMAVWNE